MLYNERKHNHFLILGNTRLHVSNKLSHPQAYVNNCVTRYCAQFECFIIYLWREEIMMAVVK